MALKIKFPKLSSDNKKLFSDALELYRNEKYDECYKIICGLAEHNLPRALYCKALLDVNPRISGVEGDEAFISGLKKAASMKYPLAYGALAVYYYESDMYKELVELCMANKKVTEPRFLTMLASIYDGFYSDASNLENLKLAAKTYAKAELSYKAEFYDLRAGSLEWQENDLYVGARLSLRQVYAQLNRFLMVSYKFADVYSNRNLYKEAYKKANEYAVDTLFIYGLNRFNAQTLMDDVMGLSDLKSVNKSMSIMEEAYVKLSEGLKEANREDYDAVWERYNEYYEAESARLASLNIHATDDLEALFPGRTVGSFVSDLAQGVQRWANTPSGSSETYYEIDGVKYKKGDNLGYLYDEDGIRTEYRIDDVDRLYKSDNEVGYFSTDGIFMHK